MTEQELIKKIAEDLQTQGFSQKGNYCKVSHEEQARFILITIKRAGYVKLAEDQSLPKCPQGKRYYEIGYRNSQVDMLKAGFRKIDET